MITADKPCNIWNKVFGAEGFTTEVKLSEQELGIVRSLIIKQWLEVIERAYPEKVKVFEAIGMEHYHEKADLIDHKAIWPKVARILSKPAMEAMCAMSFFKKMETEFGKCEVSQEEKSGWGEIYWRIVRPNAKDDIGPLHADAWFWELGHGEKPNEKDRVKIWIPVYCEPGFNGLRVVPGSHLQDWDFHGEKRDGFVKPQFDEKASGVVAQLLNTEPGQMVIFNDKLLHGGALNQGMKTRVSVEMTLLFQKKN